MIFYDYDTNNNLVNIFYFFTEEQEDILKQDRDPQYYHISDQDITLESGFDGLQDEFRTYLYKRGEDGFPIGISTNEYIEDLRSIYFKKVNKLSFEYRRALVPDYKEINSALGIYNVKYVEGVKNCINDFRAECYRLFGLIATAENKQELDNIIDNNKFPDIELKIPS